LFKTQNYLFSSIQKARTACFSKSTTKKKTKIEALTDNSNKLSSKKVNQVYSYSYVMVSILQIHVFTLVKE
jgi:hypothetical protein